ncbi:hypothetical protein BDA99DRAFT_470837 [Phascolomyces articulosus]|uniref:protein-tyrosine-phosphatase n=1 Tax=Phascolomyces articulosus TaxID=60185 RepID=A0AAD5P8K6_9FUNG|nr:hypothetical protein BDA99DRAFT_470837 [Phascolomyces articulosus]
MLFNRYRKGSNNSTTTTITTSTTTSTKQTRNISTTTTTNTNNNNNDNNNNTLDIHPPEPQKSTSSSLASAFFRAFTRRAWHFNTFIHHHDQQQQQQCQDSGVDIIPRHSTSLPNIARYANTTSSTVLLNEQPNSKKSLKTGTSRPTPPILLFSNHDRPISKRYSAGQALIKDPAKKKKKRRHSYTFGSLPTSVHVTVVDPQPRRSKSQQTQQEQLKLQQKKQASRISTIGNNSLPRGLSISTSTSTSSMIASSVHSTSSNNNYSRTAVALSADQLASMLRQDKNKQTITLIDVRHLFDYQKRRIDGSLNVNLPSLLIKRYQRGTVSNFNLENFITTAEGRARYRRRRQSNDRHAEAKPVSLSDNQQGQEQQHQWVVYDDEMVDQTSQAWTLLNVLDRMGDVYYLEGGFKAFQSYFTSEQQTVVNDQDEEPLLVEGFDEEIEQREQEQEQPEPLVQLPRRSLSYTMGAGVDKSHLHRRISLFSLDTQAARANNASALARKANKRSMILEQEHLQHPPLQQSQHHQQQPNQPHLHHHHHHQQHPPHHVSQLQPPFLQQHQSPPSSMDLLVAPSATTSTSSSLTRVVEDEDDDTAGGISPQTEADFEFIISEIIPGFLFVGPEIETIEQAQQLETRKIRRVLNMAEECNDEVLQKDILYRKIAARDTVEMKNIDWVMMEAVCFIEDAKRHHEPIYVHCKAGKSRSVTAILAYLVCSERWTLKQAYRHVIKARPNMSPNIGFIAELMKMEGRVHGRVSSFMETDWQSTSMPSPEFTRELQQLELAWQQTPRDPVPSSVVLR